MSRLTKDEPIFLDYHSTTPVDKRVAQVSFHYMLNEFGNASSTQHIFGERAAAAVERAREQLASLINAKKAKTVFTSGATESINILLQSLSGKALSKNQRLKVALSPLEHPAVIQTVRKLQEQEKLAPSFLEVDRLGRIDLAQVREMLSAGTDLLCIMAANNEIGNIYPIEEIGRLCDEFDTPFFCDASQAAGKVPIDFDNWNISYLVVSAHKIYGPKGAGALVCKRAMLPKSIVFGGEQEYGVRSGTLNVPAIAAFGEACRLRQEEMSIDEQETARKRDRLKEALLKNIENVVLNGDERSKLSGNLHISIPGIPNDILVTRLRNKVAISTGAACYAGVETPSHVLQAMGLSETEIESAIRIGIGKFTTAEDIDKAASLIVEEIRSIEKILIAPSTGQASAV
ncbi:MAG: cysteine desulfurase [Candidatus Obscuribacter sp.]|nr:cysteine desulfurase [Candidatus Obscuribacter sp.]